MTNKIRYKVKFEKIPSFAFLFVLPLLITLGFWQLHRADEKRLFLNAQAQAAKTDISNLSSMSEDKADLLRYQKVEAEGQYDVSHQFLIDNQISGGKAGYFVMTPFRFEKNSKAVLVNRGWIPLTRNRSILPDIGFDNTHGFVKGRINRFPSVGVKLPGAEIPTDGWPSIVQVVDSDILAKRLGYPLFHFQIELDKELPDGFKRDWQTLNIMPPEQHTAYAVQWFGLAATLTILFIGYSLKKNDD